MTKGNAYAVAVSGNYAYVASGIGGLVVVDINDPNVPTMQESMTPVDMPIILPSLITITMPTWLIGIMGWRS